MTNQPRSRILPHPSSRPARRAARRGDYDRHPAVRANPALAAWLDQAHAADREHRRKVALVATYAALVATCALFLILARVLP